jgi:hypothetical protein
MRYGVVQNPQMSGVHMSKFSAQIPSGYGVALASGQPSDKDVTVIILAHDQTSMIGSFCLFLPVI